MRRREFIAGLSSAATWPLAVSAQQPAKLPRIGILWPTPLASNGHLIDAFREGLRELGYVSGKNLVFELRDAQGKNERLGELAADLVRIDVDLIATEGTPPTKAALQATGAIPIVFGSAQHPVEKGIVASLAQPGRNVTGMA